jgi:aminoglycoside phosphotransferase (APT) family kinase protein
MSTIDQSAPVRAGEELDPARLAEYLKNTFPDSAGPLVVEQFRKGHSNLTYFVRWGERELVLRRPPFGSKVATAHDMGREYRVLSQLHGRFPPAPAVYAFCEDQGVLGAPFYLMERRVGTILRQDLPEGVSLPAPTAERMCRAFIDTLADLHAVDYQAAGLADLGKPAGYLQRQVSGWAKRYEGSRTEDIREVDSVVRWLTEHTPGESGAAVIHNDYKFDNVILDSADWTRIVAVLDWEMCTLGDPLADLGTAISYWIDPDDPPEMQLIRWGPTTQPGMLTRAQLVEHYANRTGRDPREMVFYLTLALFKTAVIAQQIYYRYHQGLTKDERFAFFIEATRILTRAAARTIDTGRL